MSVRPQPEASFAEPNEPQFGRRLSAKDDEIANLRRDILRLNARVDELTRDSNAQANMLAEFRRSFADIYALLSRGAAPPPATPSRSIVRSSEEPRRAAAPPLDAIQTDKTADFDSAFRSLAARAGLERSGQLLERITAQAAQQRTAADTETEALAVASFSVLAQAVERMPLVALKAFTAQLFGSTVSLVEPVMGEPLDPALHLDCSTQLVGSRSRISRVLFPGLKSNSRVLVRARVVT